MMLSFYSRIVVAYDGSELGKKALNMAKSLAAQDKKVEVHILHVINPKTLATEFGVYDAVKEQQQENLKLILEETKEVLADLANEQEYVVLKGNPAEMIVEYAKNRDVDLIVIGSKGYSNFKQLVLGSVSHNVVQHAHCPVLVAK